MSNTDLHTDNDTDLYTESDIDLHTDNHTALLIMIGLSDNNIDLRTHQ